MIFLISKMVTYVDAFFSMKCNAMLCVDAERYDMISDKLHIVSQDCFPYIDQGGSRV